VNVNKAAAKDLVEALEISPRTPRLSFITVTQMVSLRH